MPKAVIKKTSTPATGELQVSDLWKLTFEQYCAALKADKNRKLSYIDFAGRVQKLAPDVGQYTNIILRALMAKLPVSKNILKNKEVSRYLHGALETYDKPILLDELLADPKEKAEVVRRFGSRKKALEKQAIRRAAGDIIRRFLGSSKAGACEATASAYQRKLEAGFRVFADAVTEPAPAPEPEQPTGVREPRIHKEAVYQIHNHKGPRKRYVRVVEVYGENEDAQAECELIHAESAADAELIETGARLQCALSTLREPDQYPKYMFSPEVWKRKVCQSSEIKRAEVGAVIEAFMSTEALAYTGIGGGVDVAATLGALAKILKPIFGGLTLVLMLSWIKRKIESSMPQEQAPKKSFKQKYSDMFREADKKKAERLTFPNPQAKKFGVTDAELKQQERERKVPQTFTHDR